MHSRKMPLVCRFVLLVSAALTQAAPAGAASAGDRQLIAAAIDEYNMLSANALPVPSRAELEAIDAGEPLIVVASEIGDEPETEITRMGIIGLRVIESPRLLAWLSVLGGTGEYDRRLTRAILATGHQGSYLRYQHIDLPWPVRDRHWAIDASKHIDIARRSEGRIWEHRWRLADDGMSRVRAAWADGRIAGLDRKAIEHSVYLPSNRGAWTMFAIGVHRTLVAAYLEVDMGGRFPQGLVRRFTRKQLRAGFDTIAEFSRRVHLLYDESRVIHTGEGQPISTEQALDAALSFEATRRLASNRMR